MWHTKCLRFLTILLWSAYINALQKLNPFERDFKVLLEEPPLSYDANKNTKDVQELWLEQKLDHTDSENNQTWLMRYFRNDKYYNKGGPIFIFVGGEWAISKAYLVTGHMHDIARQHGGMLYYTEHRYFGRSWPENETTVENLKFLSVKQALADLAHFIRHQKETEPGLSSSKVILTGGSYSGSMVAWFTKLYPELVSAAWGSSAPVVAKMDYYEYMELVGVSIKQIGGLRCYNRIAAGMAGFVKALQSPEASDLLQRLRICDNFEPTNQSDVSAFFNGIGNYFASLAQSRSTNIKPLCASLMSLAADDNDDVEAFTLLIERIFWSQRRGVAHKSDDRCLDISFEGMRQIFTNQSDTTSGTRQWFYQTCSEFGWYTTTASSQGQPFARQVPLGYFQQLCHDVFGSAYTLANISLGVQQTNSHFGVQDDSNNNSNNNSGNKVPYEKVFFAHGQLDPWRAVGLQSGRNVIVIPGYAHCADLGSINLNDSVEMNVAKLRVAAFLRRQLSVASRAD